MAGEPPASGPAEQSLSQLLQRLDETLRSRGLRAGEWDASYEFQLREPTCLVRVDVREGRLGVQQTNAGPAEPVADCRLSLSATDFVELVQGRVQAQALFARGKLRIDGDLGLATRLQRLMELLR